MRRHLALILVLPTVLVCAYHANAQTIYFYGTTDSLINGSTRGKAFTDSAYKGFSMPSWPDQQPKELLPRYPYPQYFSDPRLPGIPFPDLRNQRNNEPSPRVIPRRRDGIEIPKFPGWRIEKLKNFVKA